MDRLVATLRSFLRTKDSPKRRLGLRPSGLRFGRYGRQDLTRDLSAGFAVAIMLVPQSMAYALLAGMPPIHGLYAATVPTLIYSLLGTSRHLSVGPPALMALLTFAGVSAIAEPGSGEYVSLTVLLALMAGVTQLALGSLRIGFVTNFLSHPVLSGFVHASVVVIAVSQVVHLLGVPVSTRHSTLEEVVHVLDNIEAVNLYAVAIGLGSIVTLTLSRRTPRLPGPLLVAAGSTAVVYLLDLKGRDVSIVGDVPQGLPTLSLPPLDPGLLRELSLAAVTVALVGFIESVSVAKAIAAKGGYNIDSNQELRALGLANMGSALFAGIPVAGSFSRTALNYASGSRSQLSSITTALLVVLTLLFLTPFFHYMPHAALAAVIIVAVSSLTDLHAVRRVFTVCKADGAAFLVTFTATLLIGVQEGILIGAAVAVLVVIRRSAYPEITELGYVDDEGAFLGIRSRPEARTFSRAVIIRFDASLYYANVSGLESRLASAAADKPRLRYVVIDCRGVNSVDVTAIDRLEEVVAGYHSRGIAVFFTHMKQPVRARLGKAGWQDKFGMDLRYQTTKEALATVGLLTHRTPTTNTRVTE